MKSSFEAPGAFRRKAEQLFTRHGKVRQQQRCIPPFVVDALADYGDERFLGGGARSFSFSKRSWKHFCGYMGQAIHAFEKYRSVYLVVAQDGSIITVAWRH